MSLKTLWQNAQEEIKDRLGKTSYETWFSALQVNEKNPETLVIETPDDFFKNWIVEHYQDLLEEIIHPLAGKSITLEFSGLYHVENGAFDNSRLEYEKRSN